MNIRSLLTIMVFCLIATSAQAVPASPGVKKTVRQADGTVVELTLSGDEHFSFYTDDKGTAYKLLPGDKLQPMTAEQVSDTWAKCRRARSIDRPARTRGNGEPTDATTGKHRGLVILMRFKDLDFVTPEPQKVFDRFFNERGYNEYGMSGSVKDYFLEQSYGQLDIDFDVVGPYTTSEPMAYYGSHVIEDDIERDDARPKEFAAEAVELASADVDYSKYDWDNNGIVDQVFIIFAGYAESEGAVPETIWPHESDIRLLGRDFVYNGVQVGAYGCANELIGDGKTNTGILNGIGTACHEFAHCLGLPDTYNTEAPRTTFSMSYWDVMDYGSYLNDSRTPAGFTSLERWFCGWLQPTELKGDMTQITGMKPLVEAPECYILYNDANGNECYLLENRQNVGFDAALPGHGLLVLHLDYNGSAWYRNKMNVDPDHQRITIIPADNELRNSSKSLAGDPFPGTTGNTALANYTTPASTLYNANTDGSHYMNKAIDSITESDDGLISFVALRPELDVPETTEATQVVGEQTITITWPAVRGAIGYQVELTENYIAQPADSLLYEFDFAKTQTESVGTTDISSALADYDMSGWEGENLFTSPNKLLIGTPQQAGEAASPIWDVPSSRNVTVVMGAAPADDICSTGIIIEFHHKKVGGGYKGKSKDFNITADSNYVFRFSPIADDQFFICVRPDTQLYLKYLAVYYGLWTDYELGIDTDGCAGKAVSVTTISDTDTNSITLTDLNPESQFVYRVRAKGDANNYSVWTPEQSFHFTSSGISNMVIAPQRAGIIFDLQGRPRGTDPSALPKGIYIIGGRKVVK